MEENCKKCKEKVKTENGIMCEGLCKNIYHLKCVDVSGKEDNVVKNLPNCKWLCNTCISYWNSMMEIRNELNEFKEVMLNEIRELKTKSDTPLHKKDNAKNSNSYSNVVSGEAIVIKPKVKQDSSKTREIITKKLKPSAMEVGITQVKNIKDGGVLIKCKSKEETEKVKKEAERSLGRQYQVKIPQQKNPCIKIVGIEEEMNSDELLECLKKQNDFPIENMELKVITIKKMVNRFMAILECDPNTHTRILKCGTLCIGWTPTCRVFDYIRIYRCFKCGGFNHKAEGCTTEVCVKCGNSGHKKADCQSEEMKCVNCAEANQKLKLDLDINHSTFDINSCKVLQKKVNIEKQKVRSDFK